MAWVLGMSDLGTGNLGVATWAWLGGRSMGGALGVNSLPAGSVASTARAWFPGRQSQDRGQRGTSYCLHKLLLAPLVNSEL